MDVILATRNPSKALQIQNVFDGSDISILTLEEVGIKGDVTEDGNTLEENGFKKARYAREASGGAMWIMADDTGIFIEALQGEPGVHAAYWGGAELSTEERMQYCLKRLEGVTNRSAAFRTFVAVIAPSGEERSFIGEVRGRLLEAPRVPPQPKMPYSSLFVPDGYDKSWAEMSTEEENKISHRGKAFAQVRTLLEKL